MPIEFAPRRRHSLSLTPLIDVVFNLLLFFMLASSLMDWRGLDMATGIAQGGDASETPVEVELLADGRLRHAGERQDASTLAAELQKQSAAGEPMAIIVRAADAVALAHIVTTFDTFRAHGLTSLALGEAAETD